MSEPHIYSAPRAVVEHDIYDPYDDTQWPIRASSAAESAAAGENLITLANRFHDVAFYRRARLARRYLAYLADSVAMVCFEPVRGPLRFEKPGSPLHSLMQRSVGFKVLTTLPS